MLQYQSQRCSPVQTQERREPPPDCEETAAIESKSLSSWMSRSSLDLIIPKQYRDIEPAHAQCQRALVRRPPSTGTRLQPPLFVHRSRAKVPRQTRPAPTAKVQSAENCSVGTTDFQRRNSRFLEFNVATPINSCSRKQFVTTTKPSPSALVPRAHTHNRWVTSPIELLGSHRRPSTSP
ncbi:hypothetical protein B0T21DRAFT_390890 [Apiosordaria backusii]|uniref:Uncharacterized protein n=1 Tax=Apiosordaria backusii TaxID=314023 RepID=A0AA40EML3_9PEZI|nr:hypothetical protein B0T21DRAFT_390890 [Apiosordaria backusii]